RARRAARVPATVEGVLLARAPFQPVDREMAPTGGAVQQPGEQTRLHGQTVFCLARNRPCFALVLHGLEDGARDKRLVRVLVAVLTRADDAEVQLRGEQLRDTAD